jgi:hypothetical protein
MLTSLRVFPQRVKSMLTGARVCFPSADGHVRVPIPLEIPEQLDKDAGNTLA